MKVDLLAFSKSAPPKPSLMKTVKKAKYWMKYDFQGMGNILTSHLGKFSCCIKYYR